MQQVAAIVREGQLSWREQGATHTLAVGSLGWFDWLIEAHSFRFVGAGGSFTAHRERYQRGGWYWRAYRRQNGRLWRCYLGKPAALTLARLEEAARTLARPANKPIPAVAPQHRKAGHHTNDTDERWPDVRFAPPRPVPGLIMRHDLLGLLDTITRPLTLLIAPTGYGKTTLLAQWYRAAAAQRALVWLTLDPDDNSPQRFWQTLLQALQAHYPGLTPAPKSQPLDRLLRALTDIPHPVTLILDDYHQIRDPGVHTDVTRLLDRLPPQARLVLSGRGEPPLPLARLRLRDLLAELRTTELRFGSDEVMDLCTNLRLELVPNEQAVLIERCEGWIGGLRLIAEGLRDPALAGMGMAALLEQHPSIDALFAEEVFGPLPTALQQFLCTVSLLDQLSGPLCDTVTVRQDSAALLEQLHRTGLFLNLVEGAPGHYRLHPRFAAFLRRQLDRTQPNARQQLHRVASDWYALHNVPDQAIRHAIAGQNHDCAARLIVAHAPRLLADGQTAPLLEWLAALPDTLVCEQLRLSLIHVWALLLSGRWDGLEARLHGVAKQWLRSDTPNAPQPPELLALRAVLDLGRGDAAAAAEAANQATRLLPPNDALLSGALAMVGSAAARALGDDRLAQRLLADAHLLGMSSQANALALLALSHQAQLLAVQGLLSAAEVAYRRVYALAEPQPAHTAAHGMAALGLAGLAYERDELVAAADYARQGIADGQRAGTPELLVLGHSLLAQIAQAQGEPDRARAMLDASEAALWGRPIAPHTLLALYVGRAALALHQGDSTAAAAWMHGYEHQINAHLPSQSDRAHLMMARVLLAQGRPEQASTLLEQMRTDALRTGRQGILPPLLICLALAYQARGLSEQAQAYLEHALTLAAPAGYLRSFLEAGPALVPLLVEAQARGVTPTYARRLLIACTGRSPNNARPARARLLTEREKTVLRLLIDGAANQQIANQLCISLSTVKKHLGAIFAKLGVSSRTQAIARARLLELD